MIHYIPIQFDQTGRRRGLEILKMYFLKPTQEIEFSEIESIEKQDSFWKGQMIFLALKNGKKIALPFLFFDVNQFQEVFEALNSKLKTHLN